jgi:hypothetical protein
MHQPAAPRNTTNPIDDAAYSNNAVLHPYSTKVVGHRADEPVTPHERTDHCVRSPRDCFSCTTSFGDRAAQHPGKRVAVQTEALLFHPEFR